MSKATENAYNWALAETMRFCEAKATEGAVSEEYVHHTAEQALRDWDGFVGPRHNNYQEEEYLLTNSQWYDTLHSVRETVECRLECRGLLES